MDLYIVLGLAHGATEADIKRAYRRLSRRYHPGINPGDRTDQEMFSRISEAYEVLMDPRRRQEYDTGGAAQPQAPQPDVPQFTEFDFSMRAHGAQASTFSELFAEVLNPVPVAGAGRPDRARERDAGRSGAPARDHRAPLHPLEALLAAPAERGELFAVALTISYVAFSIPAVIAGIAANSFDLRITGLVYGLVVVVLGAVAVVLQRVRRA